MHHDVPTLSDCTDHPVQSLELQSYAKGQLTFQSYTIHGESSSQLGGNLHATANQRLSKNVLKSLVKVGTVAQLTDHGNGILEAKDKQTET